MDRRKSGQHRQSCCAGLLLTSILSIPSIIASPAAATPSDDISAFDADVILGIEDGLESIRGLANTGDVDGDGVEDLVIASAHDDDIGGVDDLGRAYVVSGATFQILLAFTGREEGDRLGSGVACAGDVDEDGFADVLVLASGITTPPHGSATAFVFSGRTGEELRSYGEGSQTRLKDCPGDVNGDGFLDHMTSSSSGEDDVYVYSGATGELLHYFDGISDFGRVAGPAGDVDGDDRADIIVGADEQDSDDGRVYVYSGDTGEELFVIDGVENNSHLGRTVGTVGDIDRDGLDDFAAASRQSDIGGTVAGAVYIYSGADGTELRSHIGDEPGLQLASAIAALGDVTGDGVSDYVIATDKGVYGAEDRRGRVFVHSGRTGALLVSMTGEEESDRFGNDVEVLDLDVDGLNDIVVVSLDAGTSEEGRAYVFLTPPAGYSESPDLDGDDDVDLDDLLALLNGWGPCSLPPDPCEPDLDGDGEVGIADLLRVLFDWTIP